MRGRRAAGPRSARDRAESAGGGAVPRADDPIAASAEPSTAEEPAGRPAAGASAGRSSSHQADSSSHQADADSPPDRPSAGEAPPAGGSPGGADAAGAEPLGADASRADASRAEASGPDTDGADADGADTDGADASRADTSRADASRAETDGPDANRADTDGADANRADTGGAEADGAEPLDARAGVAAFLDALDAGAAWYPALLDVVARWVTPEEEVDGVVRRYLIRGEAFDWALLAQRLLEAAGDRVPADQAERMLFFNEPPGGETEEEFALALGDQKYRAHLNFQYGVVVEEVLLLAAEEELHKARPLDGVRGEPADVAAYERVYGVPLAELRARYRAETGRVLGERVGRAELQAFTYWCAQVRVQSGEPARVASDTRKAMSLLSRMHLQAARRREDRRDPERVVDLDP